MDAPQNKAFAKERFGSFWLEKEQKNEPKLSQREEKPILNKNFSFLPRGIAVPLVGQRNKKRTKAFKTERIVIPKQKLPQKPPAQKEKQNERLS